MTNKLSTFDSGNLFGPYFSRRLAASETVKPFEDEPSCLKASFIKVVWKGLSIL